MAVLKEVFYAFVLFSEDMSAEKLARFISPETAEKMIMPADLEEENYERGISDEYGFGPYDTQKQALFILQEIADVVPMNYESGKIENSYEIERT